MNSRKTYSVMCSSCGQKIEGIKFGEHSYCECKCDKRKCTFIAVTKNNSIKYLQTDLQ